MPSSPVASASAPSIAGSQRLTAVRPGVRGCQAKVSGAPSCTGKAIVFAPMMSVGRAILKFSAPIVDAILPSRFFTGWMRTSLGRGVRAISSKAGPRSPGVGMKFATDTAMTSPSVSRTRPRVE